VISALQATYLSCIIIIIIVIIIIIIIIFIVIMLVIEIVDKTGRLLRGLGATPAAFIVII
jgi:hypothetical protein